jgi:hypothetical protein
MKKQMLLLVGLFLLGCAHAKPKQQPIAEPPSVATPPLVNAKKAHKHHKANKAKELPSLKVPPSNTAPSVLSPTKPLGNELSLDLHSNLRHRLLAGLLALITLLIAFLVLMLAPESKKNGKKRDN